MLLLLLPLELLLLASLLQDNVHVGIGSNGGEALTKLTREAGNAFHTSSLASRSLSSSSFWISLRDSVFCVWVREDAEADCCPHLEEEGSCKEKRLILTNGLSMCVWI